MSLLIDLLITHVASCIAWSVLLTPFVCACVVYDNGFKAYRKNVRDSFQCIMLLPVAASLCAAKTLLLAFLSLTRLCEALLECIDPKTDSEKHGIYLAGILVAVTMGAIGAW